MPKIGVRKFYFAICTKDNETGVTYGTPKRIVGLNQIDINPSVQTATAYGDDLPLETASSISDISVSFESVYLPLEDKAALLGHTVENGVMVSKTEDESPYVAIMFEAKQTGGALQYEKLLKGKFSETQETFNTKGNSIEFANHSLNGNFVARAYDGEWRRTAVSTDTTLADSWYASVEEQGGVINE